MNKILLSVLIAIFVSIILFYSFDKTFPASKVSDIENHKFFTIQSHLNSKQIFMLGGSGAAQLNSTMIDFHLKNNTQDTSFYNLAYNADTPKQRYQSIHETLDLEPRLILYGITYYDLNGYLWDDIKENPQLLPSITLNPVELIAENNDPFSKINPKETTLNFIRDSFSDSQFFPSKRDRLQLENSPFSHIDDYQKIISTKENLQKITPEFVANRVNQDPSITNEQINYLFDIIELTQEKEINFILIILPQHEYFLDLVPERDEILFSNTITKLEKEFDIKIYDLSRNYENLNIWQDHNHVAFNTKSEIFSNDIYEIIIDKLN